MEQSWNIFARLAAWNRRRIVRKALAFGPLGFWLIKMWVLEKAPWMSEADIFATLDDLEQRGEVIAAMCSVCETEPTHLEGRWMLKRPLRDG